MEYTKEQITEARDWLSDVVGERISQADYTLPHWIDKLYPGGWQAFVEECCTFIQL